MSKPSRPGTRVRSKELRTTEKLHGDVPLVVSSAHLASGSMPSLSEVEFGLIMAFNAFQRWTVRGMTAAGVEELSAVDILILHTVYHRDRPKKIADICLVLNIEDTYTVTYAVKKLEKSGLVKGGKSGKEKVVSITRKGTEVCHTYREIRETLLVNAVKELGIDEVQMSKLATLLRSLSGQYDQAARGAVSL